MCGTRACLCHLVQDDRLGRGRIQTAKRQEIRVEGAASKHQELNIAVGAETLMKNEVNVGNAITVSACDTCLYN